MANFKPITIKPEYHFAAKRRKANAKRVKRPQPAMYQAADDLIERVMEKFDESKFVSHKGLGESWQSAWSEISYLDEEGEPSFKRSNTIETMIATAGCEYDSDSESCNGYNGRAYYNWSIDVVFLPADWRFDTLEGRYQCLLHELIHWTGHKDRLNRRTLYAAKGGPFCNINYGREELIAELGSAMLMAAFGILSSEILDRNRIYLQMWLKHVDDNAFEGCLDAAKELADAKSEAARAVAYIMTANTKGNS